MTDDKTAVAPAATPPAEHAPATPGAGLRAPSIGAEALKAFAHPLRMAMYNALRNDGPATASMLGRALGESSGQTSYHLRQLEKHGFVEDDPGRTGGRERWWRAVGFSMDSPELLSDPGTAGAAQAVLHTVLAERAQAMTAWAEQLDMAWEAQVMSTSTLVLTQDEAAALADRAMAVVEEFRRISDAREGRPDEEAGTRRVRVHVDVFPMRATTPQG